MTKCLNDIISHKVTQTKTRPKILSEKHKHCYNYLMVNGTLTPMFSLPYFWLKPSAATTVYAMQIFILFWNMKLLLRWEQGWDDLDGTPANLLGCQSFALMVVFSPRSDAQRVVRKTTRCRDSRPTEGTWKCAEDGRVWMAITAHQGRFQRVTKFLKVLDMKDLQFFLLVSSLKSKGVEAAILCAHTHHHFAA